MLPRLLRPFTKSLSRLSSSQRSLTTSSSLLREPLPPRPTISKSVELTLTEAFLKGSGPGGQKINKTSSAVQLKHLPTGIVVKSQATRSRSQNRKIARQLLAEKLEFLEKGEHSRVAVKGERERKRKASSGKKARRKYRAIEDSGGSGDKELEDKVSSDEGRMAGQVRAEATAQSLHPH